MFSKLEEKTSILCDNVQSWKNTNFQTKLIKMKIIMPEMKNTFDGINTRLDMAEDNINELGDLSTETS